MLALALNSTLKVSWWIQGDDRLSIIPFSVGERGIILSSGTWIGLESLVQRPIARPINYSFDLNMIPFRGATTVFGLPLCQDVGKCYYSGTEISQYDPVNDEWHVLGAMKEARSQHAVVEVPGEFCNYFN